MRCFSTVRARPPRQPHVHLQPQGAERKHGNEQGGEAVSLGQWHLPGPTMLLQRGVYCEIKRRGVTSW